MRGRRAAAVGRRGVWRAAAARGRGCSGRARSILVLAVLFLLIASTAALGEAGDLRVLFPGDSIWVQGGEWKAALLDDSDRAAYLDSLALLKNVEFDILVPWGTEVGEPYGYAVNREEANAKLDRIIARLEAGENA